MRYLSLFSGIEAATMAWKDFGWECVGVSEIDAFACELLQQRHPTIPNLGDITKITKEQLDELGTVDIVVGGSPCQSFSTAGKRGGLKDARGKLMYDYIQVVRTVRPKWFVWENVPGVLSMDEGRAFGTLLREMADIGYSLCWRMLDAQYFGVPHRRRRVFLIGHIGTDRDCCAKVLFDPEGRSRYFKKTRQAQKNSTNKVEESTGDYKGQIFRCLQTTCGDYSRSDNFNMIELGDRVRKLTPIECERLQGFTDNYTLIRWRNKSENKCPDGLRYKALGNSMAVPVMKWIGHNIKIYDERFYLPW
jgi:DNA (cytosine-5)-methyltransferase 1